MGFELGGAGAGAAFGLEELLTRQRAEQMLKEQMAFRRMQQSQLHEDRQARLSQSKLQAEAMAGARKDASQARQSAINLQQLQALSPGTTLGPETFARMTNPETGAALPEQFDASHGTSASLPSVSLSGLAPLGAGQPGMSSMTPETSRAIAPSFRFQGTAQQQDKDASQRSIDMSRLAAIDAKQKDLENAGSRLEQQGRLSEAQAALAEARASGATAKAEADRAKAQGGPSPYAAERVDRSLESVRALKDDVSRWNTGAGSILGSMPGTAARDFRARLDTLKGNIGFSELAAMREASKTGGALGQISDRELTLLSSVLGSLDAGQSPAALRAQLQKIEDSLTRWKAAQAIRPMSSHGGAPKAGAATSNIPTVGGMFQGAKILKVERIQ